MSSKTNIVIGSRRNITWGGWVLILFPYFVLLTVFLVRLNISDSEPLGLYLIVPGTPRSGDMVLLRGLFKHEYAGAGPGDIVRVAPEGSYINGALVAHSAPLNAYGYRPYRYGIYQLAPGQYWLLAPSDTSWDSRYAGPFPWDTIASKVIPLWIFPHGHTN